MPQLVLDLPQGVLNALAEIAAEAKDERFTDAKGMLELRAKLEIRERRIAKAVEAARVLVESEA